MRQILQRIVKGAMAVACILLSPAFSNSAQAQTTVTIGSGTGTTTYTPIYYNYGYNYTQTIYTAAEISAGGGGAGTITKIRYKPTASVSSTAEWKDWIVYLGNTTKTGFTSTTNWVALGSMTEVFNGTIASSLTAGTWMEITLSTPFAWDGTSNLVVAIDENTASYGVTSPSWAGYSLTPSSGNKSIYYYSDGTNPNPASPPTASGRSNTVPQIQFDMMLPACSGTPATPAATASVTNACAGVPFTLNATGLPTGVSGITYKWQSRAAGTTGAFADISGATAVPYTVASQTAATEYRLQVTCTSTGGGTATSNVITVGQNIFSDCYCTPLYTTGCSSSDQITNFVLGTISNNTGTACSSSPLGYSNYTTMSTNLTQAGTYTATISIGSGGAAGVAIWIDYNDNGLFESSEKYNTTGTIVVSGTGTITINVPATAPLGSHRMRVRHVYNTSGATIDPCSSYTYGETEDYSVNVQPSTACSGTPATPVASASVTNACVGVPFTLSATGLPAAGVTGITYKWQSRAAGTTGAFADISGATAVPYTVASQTAATEYRLQVTCTSTGGGTATSNVITVGQNGPLDCYCTPVATSGGSTYYITNFSTTGGIANINKTSTGSTSGYSDFHTTDTLKVYIGGAVNYSIGLSSGTFGRAIWIDFNENGVFETTERVASSTGYLGTPLTGSFVIPTGTTPATVRMRVLASYNEITPANPCSTSGAGEFEDYMIQMMNLPPCAGTPAPGATLATSSSICLGNTITLYPATHSFATGLSYQWMASIDGGITYNSVTGATTDTLTIAPAVNTTYKLQVSCANSGLSATSTELPITFNTNVSAVTPAAICGPGTATLMAAGATGDSIRWYDAATGGSLLATTGGSFTTPAISATTTYYAQAVSGTTQYVGPVYSGTNTNGTSVGSHGIVISTSAPNVYITTADIPFTGTGNITVQLQTSSGTPVQTVTATGVTGAGTTAVTVPLGITVPTPGSYRLLITAVTGTVNNLGYISTASYPYTGSLLSVTSGYWYGTDLSSNMYLFHLGISTECASPRVPVTATVDAPVTVDLGADIINCSGTAVTLDAGNAGATYAWSNGESTQTISAATSGTYSVTVTSGACTATDVIDVSINTTPVVDLGADAAICAGESLTLDAGNPGATYTWNTGDNTQTIDVSESGTYSVIVANGSCDATGEITVTVNEMPVVALGADTSICPGTVVELDAGNPGALFTWSNGEGTQTISVSDPGTYSVTVENGACMTADSIVISEVPAPVAGTITATVTAMPAFDFSAAGTTGASEYVWDFGDGTVVNTATASHAYTANGVYEVMFIATNACGESDTSTTTVTVSGVGINSVNGTSANVQVYPNPSNGLTVVEAKGALISNIEVMDNLGRIVLHTTPNTAKAVIDVKGMAQGIYTLRVHAEKGISTVKLVVKD